jgi:hypothetical protein
VAGPGNNASRRGGFFLASPEIDVSLRGPFGEPRRYSHDEGLTEEQLYKRSQDRLRQLRRASGLPPGFEHLDRLDYVTRYPDAVFDNASEQADPARVEIADAGVTQRQILTPNEDDERRAQVRREAVLRGSAPLIAAMNLISGTPDIRRGVQALSNRASEFRKHDYTRSLYSKNRQFTPTLAGISLDDRARAIWSRARELHVANETAYVRKSVAAGRNYAPMIVNGAGWHSAVFNSTFMALRPDSKVQTMTVNVGGPWDGNLAHFLNSRSRPNNVNLDPRPGTRGALNSMGDYAVLQPGDRSTRGYGDPRDIEDPLKDTLLFSANVAKDSELIEVRVNTDGGPGKQIGVYRNPKNNELFTVAHDRNVVLSGLLTDTPILRDADAETLRIIEEELLRPLHARRIHTTSSYIEHVSDPAYPTPFNGWKNLLIMGAGDSGNIVASGAFGYQPVNGKSVVNLDFVEEIVWLGQPASSREAFLELNRPLYHWIANDFPRLADPENYSRIRPTAAKGFQIRRERSGNLTVIDTDGKAYHNRDHVLLNTGVLDRLKEVYGRVQSTVVDDPLALAALLAEPMNTLPDGSRLRFTDGSEIVIIGRAGENSLNIRRVNEPRRFAGGIELVEANSLAGDVLRRRSPTLASIDVAPKKLALTDVFASGFRRDDPFTIGGPLFATQNAESLADTPGVVLEFEHSTAVIRGVDRLNATVTVSETRVPYMTATRTMRLDDFIEAFILADDLQRVRVPPPRERVDLLEYVPVAQKVDGLEDYICGAASKTPVQFIETWTTPILGNLDEVSSAGFRYKPLVQGLAEMLSTDRFRLDWSAATLSTEVGARGDALRPKIVDRRYAPTSDKVVSVPANLSDERPVGTVSVDDLRFTAGLAGLFYVLPADVPSVNLTFAQLRTSTTFTSRYRVQIEPSALTGDPNFSEFVDRLLADDAFMSVVQESLRSAQRSAVRLEIPVVDGRIVAHDAHLRGASAKEVGLMDAAGVSRPRPDPMFNLTADQAFGAAELARYNRREALDDPTNDGPDSLMSPGRARVEDFSLLGLDRAMAQNRFDKPYDAPNL